MEKIRIKALAASMESAYSAESELPDLRSPLCIAMEDADVLKAVLAVAAVGAIIAAAGYTAYKAGEWLGQQLGGSSGGGGGSTVYVASQRAATSTSSAYEKHKNSDQSGNVSIRIHGYICYFAENSSSNGSTKFMDLLPGLIAGIGEYVEHQGMALADAISANKKNIDDYRLNQKALDVVIDAFVSFFSLVRIDTKNMKKPNDIAHTLSEFKSKVAQSERIIAAPRREAIQKLADFKQWAAELENATPQFEQETRHLKEKLNKLSKDLEHLANSRSEDIPGVKAALRESVSGLQSMIHTGTSLYTMMKQIIENIAANARDIDRALSGK